ncbi:MAG: hypothetical protein ACE3JU_15310 [Paenibacillus sp.]|uniref:hypothetical protein n=1 Tax=Paenibacillus sp. TaxID=58172 RepID=UPI003B802788
MTKLVQVASEDDDSDNGEQQKRYKIHKAEQIAKNFTAFRKNNLKKFEKASQAQKTIILRKYGFGLGRTIPECKGLAPNEIIQRGQMLDAEGQCRRLYESAGARVYPTNNILSQRIIGKELATWAGAECKPNVNIADAINWALQVEQVGRTALPNLGSKIEICIERLKTIPVPANLVTP